MLEKKSNNWQEKAKVQFEAGSHFMASVLEQIYLDDVSGSNPACFFLFFFLFGSFSHLPLEACTVL